MRKPAAESRRGPYSLSDDVEMPLICPTGQARSCRTGSAIDETDSKGIDDVYCRRYFVCPFWLVLRCGPSGDWFARHDDVPIWQHVLRQPGLCPDRRGTGGGLGCVRQRALSRHSSKAATGGTRAFDAFGDDKAVPLICPTCQPASLPEKSVIPASFCPDVRG